MNKTEAKAVALEILYYRLEHQIADRIERLPQRLFDMVKGFKNCCPMCELFYVKDGDTYCPDCLLRERNWKCNDYSKDAIAHNIAILEKWEGI